MSLRVPRQWSDFAGTPVICLRRMRITVAHHSPASCQRWRDALARELPDAEVDIWGQGRAGSADYAIAWAAPAKEFFDQHDRLKAFFCTGAGVEKLLANPVMPQTIPVIRLEDAGMGAQMADYCAYAVLHWLRRRSEYDEQQRARVWKQLPAYDLIDWAIGVFGLGVLGLQVATAFRALGFNVNAFSRSPHEHPGIRSFAEQGGAGDFAAFMRASRVLIIIAPLTPTTQDRFNRETLALLNGNLVDSSPMYGSSETVAGDLIAERGMRDKLFVATKVWTTGREEGIRQMETSLKRLRVERMDLMQVHNLADVATRTETLQEWKQKKRIRYIGITHYTSSAYAEVERWLKTKQYDFLQINYSLGERESENRLLPLAQELKVAVIANRPFAEGALFRRVKGKPLPPWAAALGIESWAQYFLKWIVSHPAVTCAIPGTGNPKHMQDNLGAGVGKLLSAEQRKQMTEHFDAQG